VPITPYGFLIEEVDLATGKYQFQDLNNDGVIDAKDQTIIGNFQPKYIFGLTNDFTFKNFNLSVFIQGSRGNDVFVDAFRHMLVLNGNNNILRSVYNQIGTKYPQPNADNTYGGNDNSIIFDGSYIRFKEITVGYTLPSSLLNKMQFQNLQLYVTGANLFTIDEDYPWYDPEVSAGADVITGWDRGGYANNKSIVLGLRVSF
jgi:TonB-dependent starch-binding outer membrane protein SusC